MRVAERIPVGILTDTIAEGGSYVFLAFGNSVQFWGGSAGRRTLNSRRSGSLQAANPSNSRVPVMGIMRSTVLPVVLPPEDRARDIASGS